MEEDHPEEPRMLHPRVRVLWWLAGMLRAGALGALIAVVDLLLLSELSWTRQLWVPGWLTAAVVAIGVIFALVVPPIRYRRWRYALRPGELWIRRGIFWVRVSLIPYRRLQFVDTEQGPLERLLGLAKVVAYTAAPGTSGWIPGLDEATAEELREHLARLAPEEHGDDG